MKRSRTERPKNARRSGKDLLLRQLGARIREAREKAGMSQRDLARHLGVKTGRAAVYENSGDGLNARRLVEIAAALRRPTVHFFEESGEQSVSAMASAIAQTHETLALVAAFYRIGDATMRRDVIRLLRCIAMEL